MSEIALIVYAIGALAMMIAAGWNEAELLKTPCPICVAALCAALWPLLAPLMIGTGLRKLWDRLT